MKRLIMLALVSLSVVAVAAAPGVAGNAASAKKATGDFWFVNDYGDFGGKVAAHHVFTAIEASDKSPVKGTVFYEDAVGGSYTAKVISVKVDGQNATISAQVTEDNYLYAEIGTVFSWTLHDVAEPGVGNDFFTYLPAGGASIDLPVITAGNLQVHNK